MRLIGITLARVGLFRRRPQDQRPSAEGISVNAPEDACLASFRSMRGGQSRVVRVFCRPGVSPTRLAQFREALASVDWSSMAHAYGPAVDVPVLLLAVAVGADEVRREAWWELWGNVHHQGTVYEATVSVVPFIDEVARWPGHPDRIEALSFLREIALGDGSHSVEVREAVRPRAESLLMGWRAEPELVQRALIWLASGFPDTAATHSDLTARVPDAVRVAFDEAVASAGNRSALSEDAMDRQEELERWALAGWPAE